MTCSANVVEVFSGIQGEGIYVGQRQVFVRFAGCNLSCLYCDTTESHTPSFEALIEMSPGLRDFEPMPNPFTVEQLVKTVERLDKARVHAAVSLTGGEPLLAADFLAAFIPACGGRRMYLETNGTLPDALDKIIDGVDIVAMDIKLHSSAGHTVDLSVSQAFLTIAARKKVFVKVIVSEQTDADAVMNAALVTASVDRGIPLVIQAVTPARAGVVPPNPAQMLDLQMSALSILDDVRVIPQTHKLTGQL